MNEYFEMIGPIPDFMNKYLELDIVKRLKGISLLCGMDYASKNAYSFREYISRYDHSLNVALICYKLTGDKKCALAGLFHDISTPIFSHVVDYMNGDYINQESTEELTSYIMKNDAELKKCLEIDNINIDEITDFKKYSVVDLDRPKMCADRLDNTILVSYNWTQTLDVSYVKNIIDSMYLEKNEDGEMEISFKNIEVSLYLKNLNDEINIITHSKKDKYMMIFASEILKYSIDINLVDYNDLFYMTESDYIRLVESSNDIYLQKMWSKFRNIKKFPNIEVPLIKNKTLKPLCKTKRI